MNIRVRTPCANADDVRRIAPFHKALSEKGYDCKVVMGCYIDDNRNQAVSGSCEDEAQTHPEGVTVFIDSDITATVDDVKDIINLAIYNDIVGAPYKTQKDDNLDCCGNEIGSKKNIVEVDKIGFGFIAINNEVFNKLKYPYFSRPQVKKDGKIAHLGEDYYFCQKAKEAGFHICADYRIKVNHNLRKDAIMQQQLPQKEKRELPVSISTDVFKAIGELSKISALLSQLAMDWERLAGELAAMQQEQAAQKPAKPGKS